MKKNLPFFAAIIVVLIKFLFLLTHHIQEDAFITWRVAQNLLDFGVIGFNGDVMISASTTHMYVFISYIFNVIFGKEGFIYPLLIFNSIVFTIGSFWLSKMLLKQLWQQAFFVIIFGLLPPSIKVSILGMEYGILFFLEMALLYFGFYQKKNWGLLILPALIMFTRIDTVIFLGIIFIIDLIWTKKINWRYILGGIIGLVVVVSFNWLYFGEIVNNTITAKQLTYDQDFTLRHSWRYFLATFGNYWGMVKIFSNFNPVTIVLILFQLLAFIYLIRKKDSRNFFLWVIFLFAWAKQIIFISQKSYFDWYYWVPQILLFAVIIVYVLEQQKNRNWWIALLICVYVVPMLAYQTIHSIATGNGEWNYRRHIGLFLDQHEKDKSQWIFLEPAGFVPYYSKLKTIDEVGLVDRGVQTEMIKDKKNYWFNTVKNRQPKYILAYRDIFEGDNSQYYKMNYKLLKEFRIKNHLNSDYWILDKIYHLKPSGRDYNLYERLP